MNKEFQLAVTKEPDEKPKRVACHICHGMGGIERPNGDVVDCPNRKCESGFVQVNANVQAPSK